MNGVMFARSMRSGDGVHMIGGASLMAGNLPGALLHLERGAAVGEALLADEHRDRAALARADRHPDRALAVRRRPLRRDARARDRDARAPDRLALRVRRR